MYKGFIIENFNESFEIKIPENDEGIYSVVNEFNSSLSRFILKKSVDKELILDGQKIIDEYFPNVKADIFISHSHKDVKKVKVFANLIYQRTGLKSFIDSEVWKYADSLLKNIDRNCKLKDDLYDYNRRNVSTSYVYMMLNTALLSMIDRCECLFFLNTPNSFETVKEIKNSSFSPWIYSELSMANVIEKKIPERILKQNQRLIEQTVGTRAMNFSTENLKIALKPKADKLLKCKYETVKNWLDVCDKNKKLSNLDELYSAIFVKDNRGVL